MSEDIVVVLDALGEDDFYYRPATTKATIDKAAAEIARLRAELTTARREGMDEAARMMIDLRQETTWEEHPQYGQICVIRNRTSEEIAAAIRAAAKEGEP